VTTGLAADLSPDDHGPTTAEAGSPLTAFASPRRTLLGTGTATRIDIPAPWPDHLGRVVELLASISHDPDAPLRPTAFAALPFDRDRPGAFVVPADLHGRTAEGERWVLHLRDGDRPRGHEVTAGARREPTEPIEPTELTVRALQSPRDWCTAVAAARDRIRRGDLVKVVLARGLEIAADRPFDAASLWNALAAAHGEAAYVFAVDGFVGASPELLVSRIGATVRAQPMAGTTPRSGHPEADQRRATELLTSAKNLEEHQITIDAVHDTLLPWCSYLDAEPTPSVVAAGPVQHLATLVEGRLSSPEPTVVELVAALHPTPAVGGSPTASALELQAALEPFDRGRYAGPVGWVDSRGDGAFAVGIRSVELRPAGALLFTGVGVVADSDPAAELAETRAKAQTLLGALIRP
jgi:menaquinone-specific isochorismate synthase